MSFLNRQLSTENVGYWLSEYPVGWVFTQPRGGHSHHVMTRGGLLYGSYGFQVRPPNTGHVRNTLVHENIDTGSRQWKRTLMEVMISCTPSPQWKRTWTCIDVISVSVAYFLLPCTSKIIVRDWLHYFLSMIPQFDVWYP